MIALSCAALLSVSAGIYYSLRSPLFVVRVVEITDLTEQSPVDAQTITDLAAIPVDEVNLFRLDLKKVEERILVNSWIREVRIQKRFPQTVSIAVVFREPQALLQQDNGSLAYVDTDGKFFGKVNLMFQPDLPLLSGLGTENPARTVQALHLVHAWDASPMARTVQLSSLSYDPERGFRALVTYSTRTSTARAMVDLGQDSDGTQLDRLSRVMDYLRQNSVSARQIWADTGKKIVVRTVQGS